MSELVVQLLTKAEARSLTDRIKSGAEDLALLLKQAHDGEAWVALDYVNWREYAKTEFSMSQSRAYELLNFARVQEAFSAIAEKPTREAQVRPLVKLQTPEQQRAAWTAAVEATPPGQETTAKIVKAAVELVLPKRVTFPKPEPEPQHTQNETESENLKRARDCFDLLSVAEQHAFYQWVAKRIRG